MLKKIKILLALMFLSATLPLISLAQFVEEPAVVNPANTPAIQGNFQINKIFNILIVLSAFIFTISILGFVMGLLKMVTSGGDEKTAEQGSNMLVLSGWIFGASIAIFLLVNIIKFFIY